MSCLAKGDGSVPTLKKILLRFIKEPDNVDTDKVFAKAEEVTTRGSGMRLQGIRTMGTIK